MYVYLAIGFNYVLQNKPLNQINKPFEQVLAFVLSEPLSGNQITITLNWKKFVVFFFFNSLIKIPENLKKIWPHPILGTPSPGIMKYIILVETSMLIMTVYSVCLKYTSE